MEIVLTEKENWRRELAVQIPADKVTPKVEKAYRDYQRKVKLQGFRKGKVPRSLLRKMYGKEIEGQIFDDIISDLYPKIIEEKGLQPIAPGEIEGLKYDAEKGLSFRVIVDVEPDFGLEHYKDLSLEREVYEVDDDQVNEALEVLRERHAMVSAVEGPAEMGHFVTADIQKFDRTGVPILGERYEDRYFELQEEEGVPPQESLSGQLIGARAGETRRVRLKSENQPTRRDEPPQEVEDLYEITVKSINKKELPAIDNELAKDVGDFKSLKELKKHLRAQLESQNALEAERAFRHQLMDEVVKQNPFDAPQLMVDNYLDAIVEAAREDGKKKIDEKAIREQYRADAIWRVKWNLIRDRIVREERIVTSERDIDARIEELVKGAEERGRDVRETYKSEEVRKRVKTELVGQRVLDFIEEHAKIKNRRIKRKKKEESGLLVT